MRVIKTAKRKANKEHSCNWCNSTILKGEIYTNQTNEFNGEIYDWKECYRCEEIVREMFQNELYNQERWCSQQDFLDFVSEFNKTILE